MSAAPPTRTEGFSSRAVALRLYRTYLQPHWQSLALSMVCAAGVAAFSAVLAWLLGPAIRELFIEKKASALLLIPLAIAAVALLRTACQVGQAMLVNRIGNRMVGEIQVALFGRLVRADLAQLREVHSGAHLSSILYEAGLVREAATNGLVNYVQNALTIVATVARMVRAFCT